MAKSRQEEVEAGPFQDPTGRWHHQDGTLMSPSEVEAARDDGLILAEEPAPRRSTRRQEEEPPRGRQGQVRSPGDRRLKENRTGPTGQGQVKDPAHDHRLKANR